MSKGKGRQPRKPRQARRSTGRSAKAIEADLLWKTRLVQLECRMTITERFLGIHADQPPLQERVDADLHVAHGDEEE